MLIAIWYLIGLCGCFIGWYGEMRFNAYLVEKYGGQPDRIVWCPTPRALVGFALCSLVGPIAVVIGFITYWAALSSIWENGGGSRFGKWFTRPICGSK